jgi:Chaperone of endosialidase
MNCSHWRRGFLVFPLVLAFFGPSQMAQATCQEGCLTNQNTVLGDDALLNNTGSDNTAMGFNALYSNTDGFNNIAIGSGALFSNATGFDNTAVGYQALPSNTTGYLNTATGSYALQNNTTGVQNTATGGGLSYNTTGSFNTATGNGALAYSTTGNFNTASGFNALLYNTTGGNNIALGAAAGLNLTTGSHNIDIGNHGFPGEANTIRIGKQTTQTATFIAGISGATVPTGVAVIVDSSGHLGTTTSSAHFKDAIKPMDKASEAIFALQPVMFRYKHDLDPDGISQFGLVAEQVEKVNPDLVARDDEGKPYTVRYEAVNAMLLNEFLKEHRKVEEQEKRIDALTAQLEEQAALIQKVADKIETNNSATQIANNQ